jgi:O-antigen/teichoic acid export membrane protein
LDQESRLTEIKIKSLAGVGSLFRRQVTVSIIYFLGNITLARILAPQVFGTYAIISFIVQFFSTFADVGLGAALIQKKGTLSKEDLSTTFWLQQAIVWLVVGIVMFAAPLVLHLYPSLPSIGVWLVRAMAISFLLSSLKTIPVIMMERNLLFNKIAWVDILENLVFQIAAISFAQVGLEVWSFIIAAILKGGIGAVFVYTLSAWRPALMFNVRAVKALVKFGIPYQLKDILAFVKDAVTPLFIGIYAGATAVGYVNWARTFAFAPLVFSESFGRVAFPAFSRIQDNKEMLTRAVESSIRCMTLVLFPVTAIIIALGPEITHVVFTDKLMPGIPTFYFYCISPLGVGIFLPLYSAILAQGRSRILVLMVVLLIILEWGFGVVFVETFGFVGVAMTQAITVPVFTYIYKLVLRNYGINVCIKINILSQLVSALITGLIVYQVMKYLPATLLFVITIALLGTVLYIMIIYLINRRILDEFIGHIRNMIC